MPAKLQTQWWWNKPVSELDLSIPPVLKPDSPCYDAVKIFKDESIDFIPVLGKDGYVNK